jgi:hypothetical protein
MYIWTSATVPPPAKSSALVRRNQMLSCTLLAIFLKVLSTMHRALLLPEVVAAIIRSGASDASFARTCLLVNRLFFEETCRILWHGCGAQYFSAAAGHPTPDICHLASISRQSRERAQVYANFLRILTFGQPADTYPYGDEAQWHGNLACLEFPQLQEVGFSIADDAVNLNKADVVLHYAQPSVKIFRLHEGSELSDSFLDALNAQCPQLQQVFLRTSAENAITEAGLVRFLVSCGSLESLQLEGGFDELWARDAFHAAAQYAGLELLGAPMIQEEWIKDLKTGFPALSTLYTSTSIRGLDMLHQLVPNLTTLRTKSQSPCTTISAIASFTKLQELRLSFDEDSSFDGEELLVLATECPNLRELIFAEESEHPKVAGLDDSMMDRIARHLPSIKSLTLNVDTTKPLTMHSIRTLSSRCPKLEKLSLSSITIDWDELASRPDDDVMSTKIWSIDIFLHDDQPLLPYNEGYDEEQTDSNRIAELASSFSSWFPKLAYFNLVGGGEGEVQFDDRVGDITTERW